MSKTKVDKKVNRLVKRINKQLKDDVFGDRFWIRQIQKSRTEDGTQYYLYEMRDRLEPNRNSLVSQGWIRGEDFFLPAHFYEAINDFIVRSSFWSIYHNDPERYSLDMDYYAHEFYHYHSKNI